MSLFAAFGAIAIMVSTPIFVIPMIVIYAYSFFDTFNIRNKENEEDEPHDEYIWNKILSESNFDTKIFKKNKALGFILILVGIYLLLNNVILQIAYNYEIDWLCSVIRMVSRYLPVIIISILSIFIGTKMLTNKE